MRRLGQRLGETDIASQLQEALERVGLRHDQLLDPGSIRHVVTAAKPSLSVNRIALQNVLNDLFADRVEFVSGRTIAIYGEPDWAGIRGALAEWESAGSVEIVRDPASAGPDPSIKLLAPIR